MKANRKASFQNSSTVTLADNFKYVPKSKSYMLLSRNMPSCKKAVIFPSISHASTSAEFVHSTIPGENI